MAELLIAVVHLMLSIAGLVSTAWGITVTISWILPSPRLFDWTVKVQRRIRETFHARSAS